MTAQHPLEPLSPGEIEQAGRIFRRDHDDERAHFASIGLIEPDESLMKAHRDGDRIPRRALRQTSPPPSTSTCSAFAWTGKSTVAKRAGFAAWHVWASPYADGELCAAGPHTVMHEGQGGLPDFTAGDRDISDCDLVMWHTVAVTHVPRPEDWPVMPVEYAGFHLLPAGFFDRNPTLDPRSTDG